MISLSSLGAQSDYIKSFARVKKTSYITSKLLSTPIVRFADLVHKKNVFVEVPTICGTHVFISCVLTSSKAIQTGPSKPFIASEMESKLQTI